MSEMSLSRRVWARVTSVVRRPGAKPLVRFFTRLHSGVYRLSGGWAQAPAFPTMLLEVVGRKTGALRTTPLVYVMDGEDYVIAAAYSGADADPIWWVNLKAAGSATVQVGTKRVAVTATEVNGEDRDRLWEKLCQMYPPFLDYVTRTDRLFPIVRLTPDLRSADPT